MNLSTLIPTKTKIKFENYTLATDDNYKKLSQKIFGKFSKENAEIMGTPFPLLSQSEINVWQAYCTNQRKLEEANMPVHQEAFEILEKYKTTFEHFEIWYEAGDQVDPVIIGKKYKNKEDKEKKYTFNMDSYLLCRWGESLKPFIEIKELVINNYIKRTKMVLQKNLNNLEFDAYEKFEGRLSNVPF